ncbi:MAG: Holliday junction branch migration protein RuvA [Methanomicrobiales archaeon]|nr:Holliday junction branch migration protein RuvA [Methanomicrobiales archaeon]MDI6875431.1 Holliday junction branch migration protein RuvA [Methanomicrobiales archaeon]
MIAHLNGELAAIGDRWVVLDVNGIGYRVYVTRPTLEELQSREGRVRLCTHMAVREDAIALYGFLNQNELEVFRILIGVSGIGPQIAMNILSQIGIEDLVLAIVGQDEGILTSISGIGQKSAKRLILELRDKMQKVNGTLLPAAGVQGRAAVRDAVSALVSLGFTPKESKDAVLAAAGEIGDPTVQVLIKAALAKLKER